MAAAENIKLDGMAPTDRSSNGSEIMLRISHFKKMLGKHGKQSLQEEYSPSEDLLEFNSDEQIKPFLSRNSEFKVPMCQVFELKSGSITKDSIESEVPEKQTTPTPKPYKTANNWNKRGLPGS